MMQSTLSLPYERPRVMTKLTIDEVLQSFNDLNDYVNNIHSLMRKCRHCHVVFVNVYSCMIKSHSGLYMFVCI